MNVETLTKTCFFSKVQGLITTKCVMSVMKNSFIIAYLSGLIFVFMTIHKLQVIRRDEAWEEEYPNSEHYKMQ